MHSFLANKIIKDLLYSLDNTSTASNVWGFKGEIYDHDKNYALKSSVELVVLNVKMHIHLNIFKVLSHPFIFEVSKVYNVMAKYD